MSFPDSEERIVSAHHSSLNRAVSEIAESLSSLFDELPEDRGWRSKLKGLRQDPLHWTESQLFNVQAASRHLCTHNEFAIGGLETRVDYIVGDGFQFRVEPLPGVYPGLPLIAQTQAFVDRFVEENQLEGEFPTEALGRLDEDGEFFVRLFPGDPPSVRWIEPECVRTPPAQIANRWVRLGVESQPGDHQTVLRFWIDPQLNSNYSPLEASEVQHVKANVKSRHPRGVPVYYPVDASLRDCEDLLRGMSTTAKARAKIAVLWRTAQLTTKLEEDLRRRITEGEQVDSRGDRQEVSVEKFPFGSILRYSGNDQIEMPAANIGSSDTVNVLQARLRSIASRLRMPEWMFTGLADQKYSNAFVVEAPTYKSFKRMQGKLISAIATGRQSLIWRAIRIAIQLGVLPAETEKLVRITCTAPALESRDRFTEASTNQIYNSLGVKSKRTIQEEQGLDPDQEAERIEQEGGVSQPDSQQPGDGAVSPGQSPFTAEAKVAGQNPPHPGLVWDEQKRRYVNPNKGKGNYKTVETLGDGSADDKAANPKVITKEFSGDYLAVVSKNRESIEAKIQDTEAKRIEAINELERTRRRIGEEFDKRLGRPAKIDDLVPKDLQQEFNKASDAADQADFEAQKLAEELREVEHSSLKEWLKDSSGLTFHPQPAPDVKWGSEEIGKMDGVKDFVKSIMSKAIGSIRSIYFMRSQTGRAYYRDLEGAIAVDPGDSLSVYAHEVGHHLESQIPGAQKKVNDFLDKRLAGEKPVSLREKFGDRYRPDEMGAKDNFDKLFDRESTAYYVGKRYIDGGTEVLSMGLQLLHDDPKKFAERDPEYFDLIISILQPGGVKRA